jgi:hypothetical protein
VAQHERTGVLVLRVWIEPAADAAVRARITAERDLETSRRISVAASGVPQIIDVVRDWIEQFAQNGAL